MSYELTAKLALEAAGFRFTHSLGQNFLLDDGIIGRIADAAGIAPGDNILEIGAGTGILTAALMERGARVLALELDKSLEPILARVAPGANVVFEDALKADLAALTAGAFGKDAPFRVVANLPYYITADLLTRLCKAPLPLTGVVVMVQKEAAERVMAHPGEKSYCQLAATVQYFGTPEALFEVPPEAFTPSPHVMSVLMRVTRHAAPPVAVRDEAVLRQVIAASFAMRRKTMANNLCASFGISRDRALSVLTSCGLDERVRGEALSLDEMARIADEITASGTDSCAASFPADNKQ